MSSLPRDKNHTFAIGVVFRDRDWRFIAFDML
jgi:hypothetical protein